MQLLFTVILCFLASLSIFKITTAQNFGGGQTGQVEPLPPNLRDALGSEPNMPPLGGSSSAGQGEGQRQGGGQGPKGRRWQA